MWEVKVRFGDYKCVKPKVTFSKVPDIAVMDDSYDLLLVGEAKTPWMHSIIDAQAVDYDFRQYLGEYLPSTQISARSLRMLTLFHI